MKKRFLVSLLLCVCTVFCAIGLVACNGDDTGSVDNRNKQIVSIYNTYVAYAEENGQTPLSYEEWLNSIKGEDGINGLNGKDGLGVKSVVVNNDGHLIITYTDNNSVDAGLVKGKDGLDGNTFTIEISDDGYWVIGGNKTNVKAQGVDGKDGENGQAGKDGNDGADGLSVYEIYKKYHEDYAGTEEEWLVALINGELVNHIQYTVTFDANCGSPVEKQYVEAGAKATKPTNPVWDDHIFLGWFVDDEMWSFAGHVVTENITLKAKWKETYTEGLVFVLQDDDTYGVAVGMAGFENIIKVPSIYEGKAVTTILANSFSGIDGNCTVILPEGLLKIKNSAFKDSKNLTVNVPSTVMEIGSSAFYGIKGVTFVNESVWTSANSDVFAYTYEFYGSNTGRPDSTTTHYAYNYKALSDLLRGSVSVVTKEYYYLLEQASESKSMSFYTRTLTLSQD